MKDWDAPACKHCRGTRRIVMHGRTWIEVNCWHCQGTGNEGGQPGPAITPDHNRTTPVSEHPAVAETGLCGGCLGARVILGPNFRQAPCPACAQGNQEAS